MAAALKWTEIAAKRAVVLAARDGYVLWARSNTAAYKSGVYLASKKLTIEVPKTSILNQIDAASGPKSSKVKANLWFHREPAEMTLIEHALTVEGDYPYTLGMLLLPDAMPRWELQEEDLLTPVDQSLHYRR